MKKKYWRDPEKEQPVDRSVPYWEPDSETVEGEVDGKMVECYYDHAVMTWFFAGGKRGECSPKRWRYLDDFE